MIPCCNSLHSNLKFFYLYIYINFHFVAINLSFCRYIYYQIISNKNLGSKKCNFKEKLNIFGNLDYTFDKLNLNLNDKIVFLHSQYKCIYLEVNYIQDLISGCKYMILLALYNFKKHYRGMNYWKKLFLVNYCIHRENFLK